MLYSCSREEIIFRIPSSWLVEEWSVPDGLFYASFLSPFPFLNCSAGSTRIGAHSTVFTATWNHNLNVKVTDQFYFYFGRTFLVILTTLIDNKIGGTKCIGTNDPTQFIYDSFAWIMSLYGPTKATSECLKLRKIPSEMPFHLFPHLHSIVLQIHCASFFPFILNSLFYRFFISASLRDAIYLHLYISLHIFPDSLPSSYSLHLIVSLIDCTTNLPIHFHPILHPFFISPSLLQAIHLHLSFLSIFPRIISPVICLPIHPHLSVPLYHHQPSHCYMAQYLEADAFSRGAAPPCT